MRLIAIFGSAWVAAKSYAIVSPFALLFAFVGLAFLARSGARGAAVIAALLLGAGVIWSNALGYGGVSLGPRQQLGELEAIGKRFAGVEPALMTEYQPYGVRHFLRDMAPEGASELRRRQIPLSDGTTLEKGESADIDRISLPAVLTYRALVLRRSPAASRPPAPYRLAWQGHFYDAWVKNPSAPVPLEHLALGTEVDPASVPRCADVLRLAGEARSVGGGLIGGAQQRAGGACRWENRAIPARLITSPGRHRPTSNRGGAGGFSIDVDVPEPRSTRGLAWGISCVPPPRALGRRPAARRPAPAAQHPR